MHVPAGWDCLRLAAPIPGAAGWLGTSSDLQMCVCCLASTPCAVLVEGFEVLCSLMHDMGADSGSKWSVFMSEWAAPGCIGGPMQQREREWVLALWVGCAGSVSRQSQSCGVCADGRMVEGNLDIHRCGAVGHPAGWVETTRQHDRWWRFGADCL